MIRYLQYTAGLSALLLLGLASQPDSAHAQRRSGAVGVGGQIGSPTGLSLKFYNAGGPSYDALVAWDLDDFFFLNVHGQFNRSIQTNNVDGLEWFFGPGAFIGFRDNSDSNNQDDDAVFGISGRVGLNLVLEQQFEFYAQLTPRISLAPDTDGDLGGGVGFRYYF